LQMPDVSVEEINAALQEIDAEELASPIQANFKEICLDLAPPGGDSANAHYRLMSAYSHPSEFLLGQYINFGDAEGASVLDAVGVRDEPNYPPLWSWARQALTSLMWAGQAVDFADPRHERRSQLQAVERLLGVDRILQPSDRVLRRHSQN
jgi:hypothetical protein